MDFNKMIYVKVIYQDLDNRRDFAVRARPHSRLKNIKSLIIQKLRETGIYNSNIKVIGMNKNQRVRNLNKMILGAYQVKNY